MQRYCGGTCATRMGTLLPVIAGANLQELDPDAGRYTWSILTSPQAFFRGY